MDAAPFLTLEHVTVRLRDRWLLADTHWQIRRGENWVVWGPNGAGKTTLARVLTGEVAVVKGWVRRHYEQDPALCSGRRAVALVSSEQYHRIYRQEQLLDEFRHFSGRLDESTTAADLLRDVTERYGQTPSSAFRGTQIPEVLDLAAILSKPIQALSSGEMRKLLIACALTAEPCLLILDEPFNGLDNFSRANLVRLLEQRIVSGTQVVLIVHRREEIPVFFSHLLQVKDGRVEWQGPMAEAAVLRSSHEVKADDDGRSKARSAGRSSAGISPANISPDRSADRSLNQVDAGEPLIRMREATVRFGDRVVLDRVDWTVRAGENWAVLGPNGAGKSTLLKLITSDQLQAYANDIHLFGRPKGSGESIWEIKEHIGYVADELQARYQRRITAFDVICSGFFDSVGLYRRCSDTQHESGSHWVRVLHLEDLADRPMALLSFGQQRLILIARAMVKTPRLLILDEPCNGLDESNRRRVLDMVETIAASGSANLLYVSHRPDEMPACITHRLYLDSGRVTGAGPIDGCR